MRDGSIDVFATDHAPHTKEEKSGDLQSAAVGFTGLEIAIGAYALAIPDLPLDRFVALLSTNPARILNVAGGTLRIGARARRHDLCRSRLDRRLLEVCIKGKEHAVRGAYAATLRNRYDRSRRAALA